DRLVAAFDLPPTLPQTRQVNIDVTAESAGQVAAQALVALDVEQPPAERTQTLVNRSNLVRIARQTGGHVLDAEDATLPAPDDQELRRVEQARTIDLWDNMS